MENLLIENAVLAESSTPVSLLVQDGVIRAIGPDAGAGAPADALRIDAKGNLLLPGLYDMHAQLGQPGHDHRETIKHATEAAINGGVTGLCAMPDTKPAIDSAPMVRTVSALTAEARIPVQIAGCITEQAEGEQQASYGNLAALGIKLLTDGKNVPQNYLQLRRAMQYAGEMGLIFGMRGDISVLTDHSVAHESATSYALGLPAAPAIAEEMGVFNAMSLALDSGAALHIQTLSTRGSLDAFRSRKHLGQFSSEVALHHLVFTHEDIGDLDTNMKTLPPLRDREDTEALIAGLNDGTIDCLVSNHTPCTPFEKLQDFCSTPAGMISLDTFLPALYTTLIKPGKTSWRTVIGAASRNPRRIMGLDEARLEAGAPADFVLFSPDETTEVTPDFLRSKSRNTPWLGKTLQGKVSFVFKGGILKNELS